LGSGRVSSRLLEGGPGLSSRKRPQSGHASITSKFIGPQKSNARIFGSTVSLRARKGRFFRGSGDPAGITFLRADSRSHLRARVSPPRARRCERLNEKKWKLFLDGCKGRPAPEGPPALPTNGTPALHRSAQPLGRTDPCLHFFLPRSVV